MSLYCTVSETLTPNNGVLLKSELESFKFSENATPFNKSYTTSYQSVIVSIALSRTNLELRYLTLKNIVTLKSRLGVTHPANLCTICTSLKSTDLRQGIFLPLIFTGF